MANNNTTLSAGTADGAVIATDSVVGGDAEHYQKVKIAWGADNTFNDVVSTTTTPFPVALSDTDNAKLDDIDSVLDDIVADTDAIETAVETVAGAIHADAATYTNSTSTGIGIMGVYQATPDVVADDDYSPVLLAANGAIRLGANSGVDIGDVDILSIAEGDNNIGNVDIVSGTVTTVGTVTAVTSLDKMVHVDDAAYTLGTHSGVMMMGFAGTQSVDANDAGAIAMETDGAIHIHDGGNTITVDGTVTANPASGTIDTVTTVTTCNLADETTKVIGTVNIAAAQTIAVTATNLDVQSGGADVATQATAASILEDTALMVTDLAAIEVTQGTIAGDTTSLDSKVTACNTEAVVLAAGTAEIGKLAAGTAAIGKLAANSGVDIGDVDVTSISAGTNLVGDVGLQPRTSGGLSIFNDNDLDETAVVVKAGEGQIYSIHAVNLDATPCYLQLWNTAQGSVTVGTTAPVAEFVIPSQGDANGAGFAINIPQGLYFSTAITAAATTNSEGNGAPGANEVHVVIGFK